MMQTVWLDSKQIKALSKAIAELEDEVAKNIQRELNVASIRAKASRVLTKDFLTALDKKDKTPFRFNKEELKRLLEIANSIGIQEEEIL